MNTIILCTLIGIVLLFVEALVLLYREIKFIRALMAGIEQNLNNIWEHIHKLEDERNGRWLEKIRKTEIMQLTALTNCCQGLKNLKRKTKSSPRNLKNVMKKLYGLKIFWLLKKENE